MKSKLIKILCAIVALAVLVPSTFAVSIDSLKNDREKVKEEQAQLQEKLDELKNKEDSVKEYHEVLAAQIILTQESINTSNETIKVLNESIEEATKRIQESGEKYKEIIALLKDRIKALYTAGKTNTLEILLNSESLYDFSMRSTALETISEHDKKLIEDVEQYALETKADRELLAKEKSEVEEVKEQLQNDILNLDRLVKENQEVIDDLKANEDELSESMQELVNSEAEYDKKIAQLIAEEKERQRLEQERLEKEKLEQQKDEPNVFDACFPVPGYEALWRVTSKFGYRTGTYSGFHWGYDIGVPSGIPIVAVDSGVVKSAEYRYDWGNNVLIYHNSTYTTRSAHMSKMAVSAGDYVEKGQVIGYIGTTGQSTGPHLHFEVYKNGTRVDPEPYIR